MNHLLAAFDSGTLGVFIPIIAIGGGILAGIVKTMTAHQAKMAEIVRGNQGEQTHLIAEVQALRAEIASLKDRVNTVAIATDQRSAIEPPAMPQDIANRLQS